MVSPPCADQFGKSSAPAELQPAQGGDAMTVQEAIRILMLSPLYFRMDTAARQALILEFRRLHAR